MKPKRKTCRHIKWALHPMCIVIIKIRVIKMPPKRSVQASLRRIWLPPRRSMHPTTSIRGTMPSSIMIRP